MGRTWGISGSAEPAAPSVWPRNYSLWPCQPRKDAAGICQPAVGSTILIQQCETESSKVGEPKSARKTKLIALNEGIRQAIPRHQTGTEGGATWPSHPPTAQPPAAWIHGTFQHVCTCRRAPERALTDR